MNKFRKISLLLVLVAVIAACASVAGCSKQQEDKWTVPTDGGSITAYFSDNGKYGFILNVEGSGKMSDFASKKDAPWYGKSGRITEIRIAEGITSIGANAFTDVKVDTVIIPRTVTKVGERCFNEQTVLCAYGELNVEAGTAVSIYSQTAPDTAGSYWYLRDGKAVVWKTYKVLFIGNSFTFYSNVPLLFQKIAQGAGESVIVDSVTQGSWTLSKFADSNDEYGKIVDAKLSAASDYDAVVLQEQSTRPLNNYSGFVAGVKALKDKIKSTQTNCKIYLYSTWGYEEEASARNITIPQMEQQLRSAYENAASETGTAVSYVGKAFSKAYSEHPEINLYFTDNKHPSYAGAFLSACVHAATILDVNPCESDFTGELNTQTADTLKQIAQTVCGK